MRRQPTVLVVDDDARLRHYVRETLLQAFPEARVLVSGDGRDAQTVISSHEIDLIVTDRHMPDVDGLTLLEHARTTCPKAARVLLTADDNPAVAQQALHDGLCTAWLTKPFDRERFVALMGAQLDRTPTPAATATPRRPPGTTPQAIPHDATSARGRILVVDDLIQIGRVIEQLAARVPGRVHVRVEDDSRRALQHLTDTQFDAIITDYRMPHFNGIDLLIEAKRRQPNARRILITGYNEVPENPDRLEQAAVDAYVHKPLRAHETILLLRDALSDDPTAMDAYREQARILERDAKRRHTGLDLDDA